MIWFNRNEKYGKMNAETLEPSPIDKSSTSTQRLHTRTNWFSVSLSRLHMLAASLHKTFNAQIGSQYTIVKICICFRCKLSKTSDAQHYNLDYEHAQDKASYTRRVISLLRKNIKPITAAPNKFDRNFLRVMARRWNSGWCRNSSRGIMSLSGKLSSSPTIIVTAEEMIMDPLKFLFTNSIFWIKQKKSWSLVVPHILIPG